MRVVVITGSRNWYEREPIERVLAGAQLVIHGGARGADTIAHRIAERMEVDTLVVRAQWRKLGPAMAGHARNERMAQQAVLMRAQGRDVECFAFPLPGSSGTWDCVERMRAQGIPTTVYGESEAR